MKRIRLIIACVVALLLTSCAGTKEGGNKSNPTEFTVYNFAKTTRSDFSTKGKKVLRRQKNFRIIRESSRQTDAYIQTDWKFTDPFADEMEMGVTEAKVKIRITAQPRVVSRRSGVWRVSMRGERQVKFQDQIGWQRMPLTEDALQYFKDLQSEIKDKLELSGLRRY